MKADYKKVADYVYGYKTKHKEGFIKKEIEAILYELNINEKKFYEALGVNTCMMVGKDIITYHTDIVKGLVCSIENRQQNMLEWD